MLRKKLGGVEIQCLEQWYRWHNGCIDHATDILPLGRMLSVSESLNDRAMIQKTPFVDSLRKHAIKLLDDGAGDGFSLIFPVKHLVCFIICWKIPSLDTTDHLRILSYL